MCKNRIHIIFIFSDIEDKYVHSKESADLNWDYFIKL